MGASSQMVLRMGWNKTCVWLCSFILPFPSALQLVTFYMKSSWLLIFLYIESSLPSLCCKSILYKLKTGCQWQITSAFAWYCLRWPWAACFATARAGGCKQRCFLCRCPCACMQQTCFCLVFGVDFNIMSALFCPPIAHLVANNRFSRRFVLMQNRVSMCMQQNEYLFKRTAICTTFGAICG